ncbi:spermatogenesis-associated protein 45 [Gouania willdenowi]|uniref:spermatogenesis-associated protein 45 n=1 Tax=Gouania willdenowi TaxID=441366 RepID=UPI0010561C6D|nr:spermatogenesis-associated protein 45-like [Gouania willdenowi]
MRSEGEDGALQQLNLRRETWCRVETGPEPPWGRTERRHYGGHLRSSAVLLSAMTGKPQQQHRAASRGRLPPPTPVERRHYEESYESHLMLNLLTNVGHES